MNEILSQGAMYINSRVSDCLLHISNQYETRVRYLHINMLIEDVELRLCDVLTPGWLNGLRLRELVPNRQHSNIHRAQELVDYQVKLRHEEYKTPVLQPRS